MGKRRRNERTTLANAAGFSKIRYCLEHNEPTKAVKIFGRGMMHQCSQGCSLDKTNTILRVPEVVPKRPRR
jgi:hypothetical protein